MAKYHDVSVIYIYAYVCILSLPAGCIHMSQLIKSPSKLHTYSYVISSISSPCINCLTNYNTYYIDMQVAICLLNS